MSSVVEIEGRTMVNLMPNLSFRQNQTSQGQLWIYKYFTLNQPTKANTVYTLIFDVIENTAEVTMFHVGGKNNSFGLISMSISSVGRYIATATSNDEAYDHSQVFVQFQDIYEIGAFEVRIMIFEGDLTQTPGLIPNGYFEGLKSSYECEVTEDGKYKVDVKVTGKNRLNRETSTLNTLMGVDSGNLCDGAGIYDTSDYIKVHKGVTVTTNINLGWYYCFYDINKNYVKRIDFPFTPNQDGYIRVSYRKSQQDVQIEEGTVATSYEPYFESTKTFYLNSPLLEGDKIVTKNGKVYHYHKVGKVVLDGSEAWAIDSNNVNYIHSNYWDNLPHKQQGVILSDKFISGSSSVDVDNKIAMGNSYVVMIKSGKTTSEWVSWLINNPTTVVYELASPYYELIDEYNNTILNIPKNVAHLTHTSTVPVNNTVFTNYKDELNVLESNTQYRVMFDCDKPCSSLNVTLGGTTVSCTSTTISGTKSFLITTPTTLVDKNLVIDGIGRCGIDNIRIFKGDAEYDYVKGLWSGYEERKLENLMDTSIVSRTGVHTDSIMTKNDNYSKLEIGTCKNTINMVLMLYQINLVNGNIYTLIMDYKTPDSIISPQIGNYSYINMANKRMKTVTNSTNYCDKFLYYDKYVITISQVRQDYPFVEIKNILILEGDWTDNPPTYEEVMANEGKYAVKVKLDNPNATIFGKGGRL